MTIVTVIAAEESLCKLDSLGWVHAGGSGEVEAYQVNKPREQIEKDLENAGVRSWRIR